jgi:hypothetical protein
VSSSSSPAADATPKGERLQFLAATYDSAVTRLSTAVLILAVVLAGCGSGSPSTATSTSTSDRPTTNARLLIVSPTANEVTGPDITIQLSLTGARVVSTTSTGGLLPTDEGHVHVSVDGLLVSMAFGLSQQLPHLTPGQHSLQAEFVAVDHKPFANRVVAAVLFQVHP